ncbi:hypothetical protein [Arthrobacter sp. MSA 4-2]|nr:hypothetical protein [Arthrobacter sp. MSA 4-2]
MSRDTRTSPAPQRKSNRIRVAVAALIIILIGSTLATGISAFG